MAREYLVREINNRLFFDTAKTIKGSIDHPIKEKILKLLSKKPMYPIELAKKLNMHEQKIYYHIRELAKADAITVHDKKEIRGTTAKRYKTKASNFVQSIGFNGRNIKDLYKQKDSMLDKFLHPFIRDGRLNSKIVVGSPDPHGPFKARARDGHYAIDLALFLGSLSSLPKGFTTTLDVDCDMTREKNLIIVGGPVTNLAMAKVNDHLGTKFSDKKPWGIAGRETYTDDNTGLVAKLPNPHFPSGHLLVIAGIRYAGTKAAVIALTRNSELLLSKWNGNDNYCAVVQGYDLDGDGRVDSIELLE